MSRNEKKTDSKFFSSNKKGENVELKEDLQSPNRDRRKDAVKKVIANMTVGKDVSSLFTDVVNCIQTDNLELKKLVYLYIINYAKTHPDQALLAVNTFVRDATDQNPLIRALAIRTMGCIRVEKITEYLCVPLTRCLRDDDPYVRKTAALCVAKLYDISPALVVEKGYLEVLRDLVRDANPAVVANAVAALSEIADTSGRDVMAVDAGLLQKLLAALNECTEWGQVFILDSLSRYVPSDGREAEGIIERVSPRLQHANSAVVLSAARLIINAMDLIDNQDTIRQLSRKLAPPLVTLLNNEPEVQYVALRNINLIVQKKPRILEHEIKVFFCKYNDPIYVKMEKLEVVIRLVNERNADQVLLELKEYATEVDVDFVRRAIKAIGRCAIKLDRCAERCVSVLLELIQTGVNYVVQECIVVIKDILRRYPNRYESIIGTLCENLETLDEPEARGSMIWVIGEYSNRIENSQELLDNFVETFADEPTSVQLQILTAAVKIFLREPEVAQDLVKRVLDLSTEQSHNPDLRDRGYVYWRLLSTDPAAARTVVLGEKPTISDETSSLDPTLLDDLMKQLSSLASVYHKPAEAFVLRVLPLSDQKVEDEDDEYDGGGGDSGPADGDDGKHEGAGATTTAVEHVTRPATSVNLLDVDSDDEAKPTPQAANRGSVGDLFNVAASGSRPVSNKPRILSAEVGKGIVIDGLIVNRDGGLFFDMDVCNNNPLPINQMPIQFNRSIFGLASLAPALTFNPAISDGKTVSVSIPVGFNPQMLVSPLPATFSTEVQVALRNGSTGDVIFFLVPINVTSLFSADGQIDFNAYGSIWQGISPDSASVQVVNNMTEITTDKISQKLSLHRIFFVTQRPLQQAPGQTGVYYSLKFSVTSQPVLIEIMLKEGLNACRVSVRSPPYQAPQYNEMIRNAVANILTK